MQRKSSSKNKIDIRAEYFHRYISHQNCVALCTSVLTPMYILNFIKIVNMKFEFVFYQQYAVSNKTHHCHHY